MVVTIELIRFQFRFNRDVMPACLYQFDAINETKAEAMGWGATSFGGQSSDELLKGFLNLVNENNL